MRFYLTADCVDEDLYVAATVAVQSRTVHLRPQTLSPWDHTGRLSNRRKACARSTERICQVLHPSQFTPV